jgi:hypothetical protein
MAKHGVGVGKKRGKTNARQKAWQNERRDLVSDDSDLSSLNEESSSIDSDVGISLSGDLGEISYEEDRPPPLKRRGTLGNSPVKVRKKKNRVQLTGTH